MRKEKVVEKTFSRSACRRHTIPPAALQGFCKGIVKKIIKRCGNDFPPQAGTQDNLKILAAKLCKLLAAAAGAPPHPRTARLATAVPVTRQGH